MSKTEIVLNPDELRKLQLEELDILKEFDRICRKNQIPYYMNGGTLLGAIRHKGFIPWDDDVDVSILRHDYHRFCLACKKDLDTKKYFFQTWDTDPGYRFQYGRIRRNGTQYVRPGHENEKHHQGINIDVFPVDRVPDNLLLCLVYKTGCVFFRKTMYSPVGMSREKNIIKKAVFAYLAKIDRNRAVNGFKNWIRFFGRFKSTRADAVGFAYRLSLKEIKKMGWANYCELYRGMKREKLEDVAEYEFEDCHLFGPRDYRYYLTTVYGDYMELPPKEQRNGSHKAVVIEFSDGEKKRK